MKFTHRNYSYVIIGEVTGESSFKRFAKTTSLIVSVFHKMSLNPSFCIPMLSWEVIQANRKNASLADSLTSLIYSSPLTGQPRS